MQRYKIVHRTYYNYSGEVELLRHNLRLRPREDHELRIESFKLDIDPQPTLYWHRDAEGNSVAEAHFHGSTKHLAIESEVIIQQYNQDPLDFLVAEHAVHYPFSYSDYERNLLAPYSVLEDGPERDTVESWIADHWRPGEEIQTYALLQRLARGIYAAMQYTIREEPGIQTPTQTLALGSGSCRDFSALFMQAARYLGLAARFVSGYIHTPILPDGRGSTHAWVEVYLPGAGWKGFDPTTGEVAGRDHIAVAATLVPESATPVEGTYLGTHASELDVGVWVSEY